jgi:DNA-binding transcriptional MerR regulator
MVVRFFSRGGNGNGNGNGNGEGRRAPSALSPGHGREPAKRDASRTGTHHATELPPIPEKIYFRIGEVAHLVGVEPHVLRYWEHEFRSIRPTKSQRGQRVYSRRDVEHLRRIRGLLYEQGFTIAGAKKALRARGVEPHADDDPTMVMNAKVREALVDIRHEVETLLRDLGG